jgi:cadmium resistance protein CadD (predicted permease)
MNSMVLRSVLSFIVHRVFQEKFVCNVALLPIITGIWQLEGAGEIFQEIAASLTETYRPKTEIKL